MIPHEIENEVVRHELAGVHVRLRSLAELGSVSAGRTQQIAGRHVNRSKLFGQANRLRPLSDAGGAEENENHLPARPHM
jgi:hypothetical protein